MLHNKQTLLILGAGPAGYTAGIYAARAGYPTLLYQGPQPGGLLTTTTDVDNYPGYPKGVDGNQLIDNFKQQASRFGVRIHTGSATAVNFANPKQLQVTIDHQHNILADAIIIATGASPKWLGIPGEKKYLGKGVSTCAVCDGAFFKNQDVAVVGGGNTALEEAIHLAKICQKVYLIVRKGLFKATSIIQKKLRTKTNINILWYTETQKLLGDDTLQAIRVVNNQTRVEREIKLQGFFIAIGHTPNTNIFPVSVISPHTQNKHLLKDNMGYIQTIPGSSKTNLPGIFAAGDVQDSKYRQAITSAASGCIAALDADQYLQSIL